MPVQQENSEEQEVGGLLLHRIVSIIRTIQDGDNSWLRRRKRVCGQQFSAAFPPSSSHCGNHPHGQLIRSEPFGSVLPNTQPLQMSDDVISIFSQPPIFNIIQSNNRSYESPNKEVLQLRLSSAVLGNSASADPMKKAKEWTDEKVGIYKNSFICFEDPKPRTKL